MARLTGPCRLLACATLLFVNVASAVPLWEISGTHNRIWLLGSVHFLRAEDYPLPDAIDTAYRQSDVVVMELAMDRIDPSALQRAFMARAIDPDERTLETLLGTDTWRKATALAAEIDIRLELLQPYEPWFAALQIAQLRIMQLGFDGSQGIERHLTRRAQRDGKPILGLETLDEQLFALDTLPPDVQVNFLLQTLEEAVSIGAELDKVVVAWKQGDTLLLEELLLAELEKQPDVYEHLLVRRNRQWVGNIIDLIDDGRDYLIVTGSLHLLGADSVQNMLAEQGIETRQLK